MHLNEKKQETLKLIDEMDMVNKEIDLIAKDPEDFVYYYFLNERNKVDLKREILFSKINDISDKLINQIKQMVLWLL